MRRPSVDQLSKALGVVLAIHNKSTRLLKIFRGSSRLACPGRPPPEIAMSDLAMHEEATCEPWNRLLKALRVALAFTTGAPAS